MKTTIFALVASAGVALTADVSDDGYNTVTNTWIHNPWVGPPSLRIFPSVVATVTQVTTLTHTICPCNAEESSASSAYHSSLASTEKITVTDHTTIYTTVCPVTETHVSGSSTVKSTYTTTSTVTSSYKTTITLPESNSASSAVTTSSSSVVTSYPVTSSLSSSEKSHQTVTSSAYPVSWHSSSLNMTSSGSVSTSSIGLNASSTAPVSSSSASLNATSSISSASSTSSASTCTKPTPTGKCTPCDGQSGTPETHCGLDINTNYYKEIPNTCREVEYNFEISEKTISPDGYPRMAMVVNGQMPGPTIEANWGDWIVLNIKNNLSENGTSIHFHGLREWYTNEYDGVPSITQCPLAPGESMTYRVRAAKYGTSWWHSHFAIQTYEGVFGPLIIHGPNSGGSYDKEEMITLQDWSHATVDSIYQQSVTISGNGTGRAQAPTLDTGLINGMNIDGADGSKNQTGERFEMNVEQGETYLLRVVNTAIQSTFKFHIDGHKFKVISMDFVDIEPYETDVLNVNIGQRYNLLVTFDQPIDNYWMRSDNQQSCAQLINSRDIKGIVRYKKAKSGLPTTTAAAYQDECIDEPYASLVPVVPLTAGAQSTNPNNTIDETVTIGPSNGTPNLYKWSLSGTTFQSRWEDPTLYHILKDGTVPDYSGRLAIEVPKLGDWVYVIIESPVPLPHPIHLHGHDFFILSQGLGAYNSSIPLKTDNPPRRDVVNLPSDGRGQGGYLVLAFQADNPGVWLLHCHVGWHVAQGFALQIIENLDGIKDTVHNSCLLNDTCTAWKKYAAANGIEAAPYESGV
ncbi:laccase-2 [Acrodontium crateriforme]|uniref:Laccase-2 n=1 Tax=Acrodontium crateriforme TaxID=150365 RepID=A0AAQ3R9Z1_9PEZI|nr:laccase-2 [Acrodontium crateriforme]